MLAALRNPALVRPAALFSATTMAVGIIVTFLPLAVTRADANVAALALLVQPAAAIAGRWLAGRHGDRPSGQQRSSALLVPGVLAAAAGVLVLSLTAVPAAVIAGAAVFGLGFGVCQNVTQTVMYDRVPESAYGASSALWNLAYDGGMGLGAAGFGVIALHTGYPGRVRPGRIRLGRRDPARYPPRTPPAPRAPLAPVIPCVRWCASRLPARSARMRPPAGGGAAAFPGSLNGQAG